MPAEVRLERAPEGRRADLILDRPEKLNALTVEMLARLREHAETLRADPPRVVVVRGAGERAFSVGADIDQWAAMGPAEAMRASELGAAALDGLTALPCPVIAAVRGHCLGGGLELALACDLRLAADDARFAFPEVTLGNTTGWGGIARLVAAVGAARAKELMMTGRALDAAAARGLGVVTETAAPDQLETAVEGLARTVCANAPLAVTAVKRAVDALAAPTRASGLVEALAAGAHAATEDAALGKASFRERRQPEFQGR